MHLSQRQDAGVRKLVPPHTHHHPFSVDLPLLSDPAQTHLALAFSFARTTEIPSVDLLCIPKVHSVLYMPPDAPYLIPWSRPHSI